MCKVDRLSREHQKETDDLTAAVEKLTDELTMTRRQSGQRAEELETECSKLQQQLTEIGHKFQVEIRYEAGHVDIFFIDYWVLNINFYFFGSTDCFG